MIFRGASKSSAIVSLKRDTATYNPSIVKLLDFIQTLEKKRTKKVLSLYSVKAGMITDQNIMSAKRKMLVAKDIQISGPLLERLKAYDRTVGINQPIRMLV